MVNNWTARRPVPGRELHFVLANDPGLISPTIARLHKVAFDLHLFDADAAAEVELALHEAILNALHHGNLELDSELRRDDDAPYHRLAESRCRLEPYRGRRVHVRAQFSPLEAVYIIRDEGPGFDPSSLLGPANHDRPGGRGLLMIRSCMDEVTHNPTGNEITLIKRRSAKRSGPESEPRADAPVIAAPCVRTSLAGNGPGANHGRRRARP